MMNIEKLEKTLIESLKDYAISSERSDLKLKSIHSLIKNNLDEKININNNKFNLSSLDKNENISKEEIINGKYYNKKIDISIKHNNIVIAGIGVKLPISNIDQNLNNYFENMLGETANIRSNNKKYFQVLFIPIKYLYFDKSGIVKNINIWTDEKNSKYLNLLRDDTSYFFHVPEKMLFIFYKFNFDLTKIKTKGEFKKNIISNKKPIEILKEDIFKFEKNIISNYDEFLEKVSHSILSI